ncbi:sigma-70 family RNA polymerase sigma factor [Tissierella creatinophila]|uniref:RNA polymerase sigma-28 factor n=1 Tax=Tissierella creatinophila DSM 6911 TaxID=1123403 RepID=A0A1U7M4M2_TISCR|nr:sigma-70 family RNA polymerase sigma factor [Tissierella creatinophila]OLS02263.1 RNA polymerase sigma-28 factor precursor [Tissierella creatinophila DSM 6911]
MYEEWNGLVLSAKEGDLRSKEEILERLLPLIISSIKKYYNRRDFYEELIQEGYLCILESIENFKVGKNVYFLGYAKLQLRYLYLNKNREKTHISLNTKIGEKQEDEILDTLGSTELEPLSDILDREIKQALNSYLIYLTDRQKEVVVLFYVNRLSITKIAERLGVSYRTVVNTKTRAIEILKGYLKE